MAYMRGHFYVWSDGDNMHFWHGNHVFDGEPIGGDKCGVNGEVENNTLCQYEDDYTHGIGPTGGDAGSGVALPMYIVEEFVVMHYARMSEEQIEAAKNRVVAKYGGGSFGADGVMKEKGLPTVMDHVVERYPDKFK